MDGSGNGQVCTYCVCACGGDDNVHILALALVGH